MELLIKDRTKAGKLLYSQSKGGDITHIISIRNSSFSHDGKDRSAPGLHSHPAKKIILTFDDDIVDTPHSPKKEHVEVLISFLKIVQKDIEEGKPCKVLSHCWAGQSRSTAAAYVLLCMLTGPGKEAEALTQLLALEPKPLHFQPNELIVAFADELLERNGAMIAARKTIPPKPDPFLPRKKPRA